MQGMVEKTGGAISPNGLSEAEIKQSNIETILMDKAAELENSLSTENMKLLSCEISVDIIG